MRKKTVLEFKRPSGAHPVIANIIRHRGWVPLVVRRGRDIYWNRLTGKDANGNTLPLISADTRDEFLRYIHDGRFGEEAKHIIIDVSAYEKIYDAVVTWPDPERIEKEGLGVVEMRLLDGSRAQTNSPLTSGRTDSEIPTRTKEGQEVSLGSFIEEIERRARNRQIGRFQKIRKELKGKSRLPWSSIFHPETIREKAGYAFHYGGRKELQFNVGFEPNDRFRHGVAFSFEPSQTVPNPDVLLPNAQRFNEFVRLQPELLAGFLMWQWDENGRSPEYPVAPIRPDQMRTGVFIFLGRMQTVSAIDFDLIVDDFDRLLPLYCFVEGKAHFPATAKSSEAGFRFRSGCSAKVSKTTASFVERQLNISLRHHELQQRLHDSLVLQYGAENVGTELDNAGGQVDVVLRCGSKYWFYEIKTAISARACIREAIPQLLEYSFWPGAQEAEKLIVVGEPSLDKDAEQYLATLRARFSLPIQYHQIDVAKKSAYGDAQSET